MRKLIVVTFMSLDGFYEGPGKDVMALPMDVTFSEYNLERMKAADTVLLGADSYEGARGFWPQQKDNASAPPSDQEFSRLYDDIEKVVVSDHASLPQEGHPWAGTTRIVKREDAREEITSLKEQDGGEIVMWGSRTLWNDLLVHGLVDELHVIIGAALLGSGTRTFRDFSASLRRIETRPFDGSDSVLIRYEVLQT
jgi:dihydrofolate reductase